MAISNLEHVAEKGINAPFDASQILLGGIRAFSDTVFDAAVDFGIFGGDFSTGTPRNSNTLAKSTYSLLTYLVNTIWRSGQRAEIPFDNREFTRTLIEFSVLMISSQNYFHSKLIPKSIRRRLDDLRGNSKIFGGGGLLTASAVQELTTFFEETAARALESLSFFAPKGENSP